MAREEPHGVGHQHWAKKWWYYLSLAWEPGTCGLVAMTSAQHAEGRQFDPGQVYIVGLQLQPSMRAHVPVLRFGLQGGVLGMEPQGNKVERCRLVIFFLTTTLSGS